MALNGVDRLAGRLDRRKLRRTADRSERDIRIGLTPSPKAPDSVETPFQSSPTSFSDIPADTAPSATPSPSPSPPSFSTSINTHSLDGSLIHYFAAVEKLKRRYAHPEVEEQALWRALSATEQGQFVRMLNQKRTQVKQ